MRRLLALLPLLTACGPSATPLDVDTGDFRPPPHAVYAYEISYDDPARYRTARDEPLIRRCLEAPGVTGSSVRESLPPGYAASVELRAVEGFEACLGGLENVTFSQSAGPRVVPPDRPGSSEICASPDLTRPAPAPAPEMAPEPALGTAPGAAESCAVLLPADATALRGLLEAARPAPPDLAYCLAIARNFTLRLEGAPPLTASLSLPCGPARGDGVEVGAPPGFEELVTASFARAALRHQVEVPAPAAATAEESDASFLARCAGSYEQDAATADLVGLDEVAATARARAAGLEVRVVARFPDCLPITRDLRSDRLNLVVRDARVLGGFRF